MYDTGIQKNNFSLSTKLQVLLSCFRSISCVAVSSSPQYFETPCEQFVYSSYVFTFYMQIKSKDYFNLPVSNRTKVVVPKTILERSHLLLLLATE